MELNSLLLVILGIIIYLIGKIIERSFKNKSVSLNRLKFNTKGVTAGGTINNIGVVYFDTRLSLPLDIIAKITESNERLGYEFMAATVQYQFFSIFYIPIIPMDCHYVYYPLDMVGPTCTIFATCKWKFSEIMSFYCCRWGFILFVIGLIWFISSFF